MSPVDTTTGRVVKICCGPYDSLAYLLIVDCEALLIDAGPPADTIQEALEKNGASLRYVLLTHTHFDHLTGLRDLQMRLGVEALAHPEDISILEDMWPSHLGDPPEVRDLKGDVTLRSLRVNVMHTPGHTPGSVCYHVGAMKVLFTGDTLFAGNIGRTDLKFGNATRMKESLLKIMKLDPETLVLPGHGEPTTIEAERRNLSIYLELLEEIE